MSNYVILKLYNKDNSTFVENFEGSTSIMIIFCLENERWTQECMPPLADTENMTMTPEEEVLDKTFANDFEQYKQLVSIKHLDNGIQLLQILNDTTKLQQINDGVKESDIKQGVVIVNTVGEIIVC